MSLLNNNEGWISFGGEPTQGITPPAVRLRSGTLTPERRDMVQDAYSKFSSARKLSVAGGGYFAADRKLPDGTIVRMVSINNIDHVHIWAADPVPEEAEGVTFWCTPWDEAWIADDYAEVFTIPRWLEIGPEDDEVEAIDFLQDLARSESYEPPGSTNYPGNQTWFAPPPHQLAGTVVSWWGLPKRYANSERDLVVAAAGMWGRATWPLSETVSLTDTPAEDVAEMLVAPTGGLGGAIGEHMFDMLGATTLPGGVSAASRPQPSNRGIWINGARIESSFEHPVNSACLQRRGDSVYLKVVAIISVSNDISARVYEKLVSNPPPGGPPPSWAIVGSARIDSGTVGIEAALPLWSNSKTRALSWVSDYIHLTQPFFWNADGTKAVSVAHYITNPTNSPANSPLPREKFGTHAVIELTVGVDSVSAEIVDQTLETVTRTGSSSSAPKPPEPPSNAFAESPSWHNEAELNSEYASPIAADYAGNALSVLKTHLSIHGVLEEDGTNTNTVYSWEDDGTPVSAYFSQSGTAARSSSVVYESWVTFGGDEVSGTRTARTTSHTDNTTITREVLQPDPNDPASYGEVYTNSSYIFSGSGSVGLWGLAAGDLRGSAMIHNTPMSSLPGASPVCQDSQSNYAGTSTYNRVQAGATFISISATVSDNDAAGVMRIANLKDLTSYECDRLLVPTMRHNIGTISATFSGGSTTITRTGPYGAGPWASLDDLVGGLPQMNPALGIPAVCPIPWGLFNPNMTGTSSLSANAPRTSLCIGGAYFSGSMDVVGGYGNSVLSASAITPDTKTQYLGAVLVAMTPPDDKDAPVCQRIETWLHDGVEFDPTYPPRPDPETSGATLPFPHRGNVSILLDPIFIGPLP